MVISNKGVTLLIFSRNPSTVRVVTIDREERYVDVLCCMLGQGFHLAYIEALRCSSVVINNKGVTLLIISRKPSKIEIF